MRVCVYVCMCFSSVFLYWFRFQALVQKQRELEESGADIVLGGRRRRRICDAERAQQKMKERGSCGVGGREGKQSWVYCGGVEVGEGWESGGRGAAPVRMGAVEAIVHGKVVQKMHMIVSRWPFTLLMSLAAGPFLFSVCVHVWLCREGVGGCIIQKETFVFP